MIATPRNAQLLLVSAHIDSAISHEPDEAVQIWNASNWPQSLAGWQITAGTRKVTFPLTSTLAVQPGQSIWCTAQAVTFRLSFGEEPACEWAADSDPAVPNLTGNLTLPNPGGLLQLLTRDGQLSDTLIYGNETQPAAGWNGPAAQLYARGDVPAVGQIWQRKLDPQTNLPVDSDQASDWAGDLADLAWGRRVRMPGWNHTAFALPATNEAEAMVQVLVGPEGLYQPIVALLEKANSTIDMTMYTFEHPALAQQLINALQRGVRVRLLIEGSPAGGITDLERWCLLQIANAGGDIRFSAVREDAPKGYRSRYRFVHAKYFVVDNRFAAVGTDNINYDSFPVETHQAVGGRRGYYLVTDAQPVVQALNHIFAVDWVPDRFLDLFPFTATHNKYGAPPPEFVMPEPEEYPVAVAPFRTAVTVHGVARFQVLSAPENALRPDAGLFALLARAGAGDEILVEQLYEHKHWYL